MTRALAVNDLPELVERWVDEGLVTAVQAERMLSEIEAEPARSGPGGLLVEAFAYLGGVVVLVAAGLLVGQYWGDVGVGVRLALVGAVAALLLAAGTVVPDRLGAAATRLRSVLWLLSTGSVALFLGLAANERHAWTAEDVGLVVSAGAAAYALALWLRRPAPLQQLALFAGTAGTAAFAAAHAGGSEGTSAGLAIWAVSAGWLLLARSGLVGEPLVGYGLGAVGLLVGALATTSATWGLVFATGTVAALVTAAVLTSSLPLLGLGAFGALQVLPRLVDRFFPGRLAGPLVLLVVGAFLLVVAFRLARRAVR